MRAAAPGIVTLVGEPTGYEGYGNIVAVDVGTGYTTLYAHLASWTVQPGNAVETGQLVGIAGCTGWCTGTHLHFEVRQAGRAIDPSGLMLGRDRLDPGGRRAPTAVEGSG